MPHHVDPPPPGAADDDGVPGCLPLPNLGTAWERLREAVRALANALRGCPRTRPVNPSATYLVLHSRSKSTGLTLADHLYPTFYIHTTSLPYHVDHMD